MSGDQNYLIHLYTCTLKYLNSVKNNMDTYAGRMRWELRILREVRTGALHDGVKLAEWCCMIPAAACSAFEAALCASSP